MAGMSLGKTATPADSDLVTALFEAVGKIHVVDEKLLNAVTGVRYIISPASALLRITKALHFILQVYLYNANEVLYACFFNSNYIFTPSFF